MSDGVASSDQLRTKLQELRKRIDILKSTTAPAPAQSSTEFTDQIAALEDVARKAKIAFAAARTEVKKSAEDPVATLAKWKAQLDSHRVGDRADQAETYAQAAARAAMASVEEAEKAALDATQARADATAATVVDIPNTVEPPVEVKP